MEQLVYVSYAAGHLDSGDVFEIVAASAARNPGRELTGFLSYAGGLFVQYIEGPPHALDTLLATLRHDPRHHGLEVIERQPIATRRFPDWRMERVQVSQTDGAALTHALERSGLPTRTAVAVRQRLETRFAA